MEGGGALQCRTLGGGGAVVFRIGKERKSEPRKYLPPTATPEQWFTGEGG